MNCHRAHQLVSPYLDHQLTGAEMLEIQRHLAGCRACTQEYQEARYVKSLLRSLRVQEPVGPLETRIAHRLTQQDAALAWALPPWSVLAAPRPQRGRRLAVALALSCVALFAITPSFAPPAADVASTRPAPPAFGDGTAFAAPSRPAGAVLRAAPVSLGLMMTQSAPSAGGPLLNWAAPVPPDARAAVPYAPPLVDVGAEPLGDPAADGYVALADYRSR